jgi:hypothetical protein
VTKLDDMLAKWPMREPTQLEVDEAAERVTAALEAGQLPASVDESLFAPPLPKTTDEGQTSAPRSSKPGFAAPGIAVENKMSKDRTRNRTSFQELAKLATTPPPPTSSIVPQSPTSSGQTGVLRAKEADTSDSGIVDLKMIASLDPTGAQRAESTPLAASGLFEDESAPPKPAVTAAVAQQVMSTSSAPSAPVAASAVAQPSVAKAKEEKKGGGGVLLVLGGLVTAAAIAAGAFFFIKHQKAQQTVATVTTSAPDKAAEKAPTKPQTTATAAATVAQNDTTPTIDTAAANPDPSKPMLKFHAKPTSGGGGAATPQETAAAPTGTVDPKLIANIPTGGAGGGSGDLAEAMKTAAGGGTGLGQGGGQTDQGPKVAGNVAQRPSQGQVAGAIGSVMPSAKACLGPDDPMSRATVTFQSDGTVKSVSVSGFAAGKPAEACIKSALSKATVAPFAEATYPVPVTIRSN